MQQINPKEVEAVKKKKDGTEITENWQGVPLKEVLAAVGVADYQSVIAEAGDGYSQEYTLK